jgi:hypothetical protein
MIIYFLIYIPFVFCGYLDVRKTSGDTKRIVIFLWVIIFTLFRGLRWEIGTDWEQFHKIFLESNFSNIFTYDRGWSIMEPGYMFINALINVMGFSYSVFLLLTNLVIMLCYADFSMKHTKYPIMTLICLISLGLPFPVRQTLAVALIIWSYRFIVEKKIIKYIIIVFVAFSIHSSAIIALPIYFLSYLNKYKISTWIYLLIYIITYFFSFSISRLFQNFIPYLEIFGNSFQDQTISYMDREQHSVDFGDFNNSMLNGFSYVCFFILFLYLKNKNMFYDVKSFVFFFNVYFIHEILLNIGSHFIGLMEAIDRLSTYFVAFPLFFPIFFAKYGGRGKVYFILFVLYMLYKFYNQIFSSFYYYLYLPYKTVF